MAGMWVMRFTGALTHALSAREGGPATDTSREVPMLDRQRRLAAIALVAVQVIHALVPARTAAEGYLGAILGALALAASIAALAGVVQGREWGRKLLGLTGA